MSDSGLACLRFCTVAAALVVLMEAFQWSILDLVTVSLLSVAGRRLAFAFGGIHVGGHPIGATLRTFQQTSARFEELGLIAARVECLAAELGR